MSETKIYGLILVSVCFWKKKFSKFLKINERTIQKSITKIVGPTESEFLERNN